MKNLTQNPTNINPLLEAALYYVEHFHWPVFPLRPHDKTPLTSNGVKDATIDADQVRRWWQATPDANIGLHVGAAGLVALDFDINKPTFAGGPLLAQLQADYPTTCAQSGGGGAHLLYQQPTGAQLGNKRNALPAGIDVRGWHGYIVLTPSIHPSGTPYRWLKNPHTLAPAPLPDFLLALLRAGVRATPAAGNAAPSQPQPSLDDAALLDKVRASVQGAEFDRLWSGDLALQGGDHSGADAALLRFLAYWTGKDPARMDGLFRQSGLCRDKWLNRADYRQLSIDNAIAQTANIYTGPTYDPAAAAAARAAVGATPGSGQPSRTPYQVGDLNDLNMTDYGNAETLALLHGAELRYCHTRESWLIWEGWRWRLDNNGGPMRAALSAAKERYHAAAAENDQDRRLKLAKWAIGSENANRLRSTLSVASNLLSFATSIEQWDTDPDLLATPSGTVNLRTGTLQAAAQNDYISLGTQVPFDAAADCPRWRQFLHEVFGGDADLIGYIQRAAGYSLSGNALEQVLFLAHGHGANGKSTFLDILAQLAGDFHAAASFATFDANERDSKRDDLAALVGKRLATLVETEEDRKLSGARVKAVTGLDPISCRHLFGRYFTYTPVFKPWIATNHKPVILDDSDGMWRRIKLIPFTQSFAGNPDRQLLDKLQAELPGILTWAVEGAVTWHRQGLGTAAAVEAVTGDYRNDSDLLGQWIADCCVLGSAERVNTGDAYRNFKLWVEREGHSLLSATAWGRRMVERPGIVKRKPFYHGIGLPVP